MRRTAILLVICATSLVAPTLLCLAVLLTQVRSGVEFLVLIAAAEAWMAALWLANWWEFTGLSLRWVWFVALSAVVAGRWLAAPAPWRREFGASGIASTVVLALALAVLVPALRARRHPGRPLELRLPLQGGRFLVADGGDGAASFFVNYHYGFPGHRAKGVSASMRYATDIVEIGRFGCEAPWLLPPRNEDYRIWGRPVHAPCDGVVAQAVNDVVDNTAFGSHRPYGVGNHVVIRTGADVYVVLGHLRQGSVRVRPGEALRAGEVLGEVGNSGWTERPHIHLQAMCAPDGNYWRGDPVPMRFDGRFLVKNQALKAGAASGAGPPRGAAATPPRPAAASPGTPSPPHLDSSGSRPG